jgi:hypothetical protein
MKTNSYALQHDANRASSATADAALEFARFRVLLRRRQLLADGVSVVVGTRAFDLLLVLLEADGLLFAKEDLLSRVWPGHRGLGREPQGTGLRVAQSARRGPRCHPDGIRRRLPIQPRALRDGARTPVNLPCHKKALVWPNSVSTELSAIAPV